MGSGEAMRLTQGSLTDLACKVAISCHKTLKGTAKPNWRGTEGGRSACSTDDLGPEKPGNRVEEKTLTIGMVYDSECFGIVTETWEGADER